MPIPKDNIGSSVWVVQLREGSMNKLVSKSVKLFFALSIIFSSAVPMQNVNASETKADVVSPVEIASEPTSTIPEMQSATSQHAEAQPVGKADQPEYEVVQNADPYLMSLALGNDQIQSQFGPNRNNPDEGIPDHAYSPFDDPETREACPSGGCDYVSGRVLIKLEPNQAYSLSKSNQVLFQDQTLASTLAGLEITNLTPIFLNAEKPESGEMIETVDGELIAKPDLTRWFQAESHSEKGLGEVIQTLQTTVGIAHAEPDYVRKPVGEMTAGIEGTSGFLSASPALLPGSTTDPLFDQQWHHAFTHVPEAWAYLESQGLPPGGSRDIVVAVIDTGVDYTHPDLAANIWINTIEFNGYPGVDDDGNGYIDDINGVNTTHPGWDPKDDHGHGTHVAGIIAAQAENQIGGVGIAYNTQIMVLKAAQYSGVLAASDIAEAIYYAVSKGADIINMSFGSYARSAVEEDALAIAFGQAVLVAAAGNDQMVNPPCGFGADMYPAAYNWVLGVMASTQFPSFGDFLAGFSNYDCTPYDSHEYELMAPGVDIWSTLPENQYAAWSGTSMSAPVVSGIAALARTYWSDTQLYTSRFIMGQIAATGPLLGLTQAYQAPDALAAITTAPIPRLNYLQHWVFDTPAVDPINDADGIIDAGEVVNLGIVIRNHWGQASDVTVLLEPVAEGAVYPDPYVTMITDTVIYDPIGSFNWQDNGLIYTEGVITGVENPFQFTTNPDTPNDHVIPFRLTMTARNGFDPEDTQTYSYVAYFYLMVQRGRVLPFLITEDMTLTKDYFWLINNPTLIMEGTTLTVTEGTQIQLTVPEITDPYSQPVKPRLQVEGSLIITGTASEPVELFTGLNRIEFPIQIFQTGEGYTSISYAKISNPVLGPAQDTFNISTHGGKPLNLLDHVYFQQETSGIGDQGLGAWTHYPLVVANVISNCIFYQLATDLYTNSTWGYLRLHNDQDTSTIHNSLFDNSSVWLKANSTGSVFGGHSPNSRASLVESGYYFHTLQNFRTAFPRQYNGNTYVLMSDSNGTLDYPVYHSWTYFQEASHFAEKFGGYPVVINDVDEEVFLWNYITYEATQSNFQTEYPDMTDCGSIWTCWELFSEESFFVGLSSHNPDHVYRWLNGEPLNYINWAEGEPSEDPSLQQFVYTDGAKWRSYDRLNGQVVLELPGVVNDEALEIARQQILAGDIDPEFSFTNNAILNDWWNPLTSNWLRFKMDKTRDFNRYIQNNYWGTTNTALIDVAINDFHDDFNLGTYVYQPILEEPPEDAYPFVSNVVLSTATQPDTLEVGAEMVTFFVSFNRDMDMGIQPLVAFGPSEPYTDHVIEGDWVSPREWVGAFQVTPMTGNGYQLMRVQGAVAADDPWLVTGHDSARFRFNIIVSGSAAMNLQATGGEGFVDLSWTQSDFDLLAGFNLYRSDLINGSYNRINSSILPPETRTFHDTNVVPGRPYYYKFTVVKSDMTESDFSNIASATPLDTIPPVLTHTPVTSAAPGQPLQLVATATDNVAVNSVTLFYRHVGDTTYTSTAMVRTTGNEYYATIEGSLLSSPGIEYYIETTDGISITRNGRAENPNLVSVVDRPVVTIVTPNTGPAAGGTAVTITGSNFKSGATVTFGGMAASNVVFVSSNQITCITPAHIPETVDVRVTNPDAQFGVLLNGFSFVSTAAQISLPNTGGGTGNVVTVPINAANINGLLAASLTVNFDPTVLSVQSASTGTLTADWAFASNLKAPGQYRISMSNASAVSGAGTLANIEFLVTGDPGSSSALTISEILLNDGAITVELADGLFSVDNVYNVSGLVSFWNGAAPVSGALLTLTGDQVYSAMSGLDGNYTIQGAAIDEYLLTPSKEAGDNGISAYDASFALQHDVGLITLTGSQALAADVNSNGYINSMDAAYILQKTAGLISLPFPGSGVVWKFTPISRSIPELTADVTAQDFTAILLGDISGNWVDPGEGLHDVGDEITAASAVLTIPAVSVLPGGSVDVPINLDITDAGLLGADLAFTYDPTHVSISNIRIGSLAAGWSLVSNLTEPSVVRIAMAGAMPITADGELILFTVTALGDPGSQSALTLTFGDLNEGAIPSTLVSGSVYIAVPVTADFSATPTSGPAPLAVAFTNLSAGDWTTASWNFGDGATSSEVSPSHTYATEGTFTVSLTVSGVGGTDIETKTDYIQVTTLNISGSVLYWNESKVLPGTVCTLSGDNTYSGTTDLSGYFSISGILAGNYNLTPSKQDQVTGITAYDAALALRHAADIAPLTGYAAIAADVNQSGEISSLDASYILQKSVGLIETFPDITSMWLFDPTNYTYPNLTEDLINQDFIGILLGDPSGNWSIEGGKMGPSLVDPSSILTIIATPPDVDGNVTATIFLEPNGTDTLGLDLTLQYDPSHAELLSISKGEIGDNWIFATNHSEDGVIRLGVADTQPLAEMQSIAVVEFHLLDLGRTSYFAPVFGSVNEGEIPIDMTGATLGGVPYKIFIPVIVR